MSRPPFVNAALLFALLALAAPVCAQGQLKDLERAYQRCADAHHDLGSRIAGLEDGLARQAARLAPITRRIAELAGDGLLARNERRGLRREQNRIALEVVKLRRGLRVAQERERVARLDLLLAGCDYASKLFRLANRDTARATGEGARTSDRQARSRLSAAQAVLARLQRLKQIEDPEPIPVDSLFAPETSAEDLRNLQADCLELADETRAEAARFSRLSKARKRTLAELRRSTQFMPSLARLVPVEEAATDRLCALATAMAERAVRYEAEVSRLEAEITRRALRALGEELRRRG